MAGFVRHLNEAIALNRKRKKVYASLSEGKTIALSNTLIFLEYIILPIAWTFDMRGKKFNKQGIPIVQNDFMPMHVKDANNRILHASAISDEAIKPIDRSLKSYIRSMRSASTIKQLIIETNTFYTNLISFEKYYKIRLAMTKHLLESIKLIARNGLIYSKQTQGESNKLTWDLIRLHCLGLRFSLKFDQKASLFHRNGIGIVVNDLPTIKFN